MSHYYPFARSIKLHVKGRITAEDAARQERTARAILKRLGKQPGVILADDVGMGKTFVALAVAVSVALNNKGRRPVVVMVPPSLREKWPADFELFRQKCLKPEIAAKVRWGKAERAVEFLKLLDDPPNRRKTILFVTHGAMSRGLSDRWTKLALIYQALRNRHGAPELRRALSKVMGALLHMRWVDYQTQDEQIWLDLLKTHPSKWLDLLHAWGIDPENDNDPDTDDDPVPKAIADILPRLDTDQIYEALQLIPRRRSKHFEQRLKDARRTIQSEMRPLWETCVHSLKLQLPLLILDEAHHLKNPGTRLASLFHVEEARDDAAELSDGQLAGAFERMLFLTATPFQLGHAELCSVLDRFRGARWRGKRAPHMGRKGLDDKLTKLRESLDAAQAASVTLDTHWGRLRHEELSPNGSGQFDVEEWWNAVREESEPPEVVAPVLRAFKHALTRMKEAERLLKPWVIRHMRSRQLPVPWESRRRRLRLPGEGILDDTRPEQVEGLPVKKEALLPFLLAARASHRMGASRPLFAEGLASSYEAFLHTRSLLGGQKGQGLSAGVDADEHHDDFRFQKEDNGLGSMVWYLDQLRDALPADSRRLSEHHPKVAATVRRAVQLWESGEKVVVFCHWIETGKTLRRQISAAIAMRIREKGAGQLGCAPEEVDEVLDKIGKRFFDVDSPVRLASDAEVERLLQKYEALRPDRDLIKEVVRRVLRTPAFLVRFFPLNAGRLSEEDALRGFAKPDASGMTLEQLLKEFFQFLVERCGDKERELYLKAVSSIQTGSFLRHVSEGASVEPEDVEHPDYVLPNVRLVNGSTKPDTRQRLMLAFNTPFFPEILISSRVLAEGVDLHRNCRFVIHHDLCWNPSDLEQRTGRIDRIGAKAEVCGHPIHVYMPFVGETQDEKMYRVVMDRERWFGVVMGENYKLDPATTEKLATRLPLPMSAARDLAFHLEVWRRPASENEKG